MPLQQQFFSTENGSKCNYNIITKPSIHDTNFVKEFSVIFGCNLRLDAIDQIIAIDNDSNQLHNSITVTAIVYFKIHYNCNIISRIAIGIAVYDMFNVVTSVINILIKLSMLVLFLDGLFDGMKLKLNKLTEFKYSYDNATSITMIVNFNSSSIGVTETFCLAAICLMVQVITALTSTITVAIEFDANIVLMDQLLLNSGLYLSIDAVGCHTQVLRNVCDVFYFFFLCCIFGFFGFFRVCDVVYGQNMTIYEQ